VGYNSVADNMALSSFV